MKSFSRTWITAVLLSAAAINSIFLLPNFRDAVITWASMRGLSNAERRYRQRGAWYQAVLETENKIPAQASVRLVSAAPPWFLAYYFYPRLFRLGSVNLADRDLVRKRYPNDWVLVYSEVQPIEMTAYPPFAPEAS